MLLYLHLYHHTIPNTCIYISGKRGGGVVANRRNSVKLVQPITPSHFFNLLQTLMNMLFKLSLAVFITEYDLLFL